MIYRYKLSKCVSDRIYDFAKIHEYDDRYEYKKAWEKWCDENKELIDNETKRLESLGFTKCVLDKMYKAGRYYFRKKSEITQKPKERRKYISMLPEIIDLMDRHISANKNNKHFKPSDSFNEFCIEYEDELNGEIERIKNIDESYTKQSLAGKIKKTYKNRYNMSLK